MPLPKTKQELLINLKKSYEKLDAEFDAVTTCNERMTDIEGNISCCDVVAYQIGWGKLLMSWENNELNGKLVQMPCESFKWNQLGELAQHFYQQSRHLSLSQLRVDFNNVYQQLVDWITNLSTEELFTPQQRNWTGEKWSMVKWIQINTIAPYQSARTKVRRWKREQKNSKKR